MDSGRGGKKEIKEGGRKEISENQFESQVSHTILARTCHFSLGLNFLISKSFTPLVWNLSSASNVRGHITHPPCTQGGSGGPSGMDVVPGLLPPRSASQGVFL